MSPLEGRDRFSVRKRGADEIQPAEKHLTMARGHAELGDVRSTASLQMLEIDRHRVSWRNLNIVHESVDIRLGDSDEQ